MSRTWRRLKRLMQETECEWLACSNPLTMTEFLRVKASQRKVRHFAVGCCRLSLPPSTPERMRLALEVAERFADGLAGEEELLRARSNVFHAALRFHFRTQQELRERGEGAFRLYLSSDEVRLNFAAEAVHTHVPFRVGLLRHSLRWNYELKRVALVVIRDVLGNPFRPVMIDQPRLAHAERGRSRREDLPGAGLRPAVGSG